MAKDAKLEQLKIAQDQAFSKKQDAYQVQQISWDRLSNARDKMNRAFEIKQNAHQSQNQAWQDYRSVCERNGTRIEYLNSAQERAFQNMKDAFDRASSAHDRRDGLSAKNYATEGHNYKSEAQVYVQERRRLVEDCRSAKTRHEPYKRAFEDAKIAFGRAKDEHEQAKATHERANTEFKRAKEEFNAATKAFQSRLSELKAQKSKKKLNNRALAAKAGVPYQYRDDVYVSEDSDGTVNIYFGGVGEPAGPGHGHYAINSIGDVIYKREPWDQHGPQNFRRDPDLQRRLGLIALNEHQRGRNETKENTGEWSVQYDDIFVKVRIRSGYSSRYSKVVSEFIVCDKDVKHEHLHITMDENGQELFAEWRPNRGY